MEVARPGVEVELAPAGEALVEAVVEAESEEVGLGEPGAAVAEVVLAELALAELAGAEPEEGRAPVQEVRAQVLEEERVAEQRPEPALVRGAEVEDPIRLAPQIALEVIH